VTKFSERLKELREDKEMTIPQMAEVSKIAHQTIHRWERGERQPGLESILLLCEFFQCTPNVLLGFED